MTRLCQFIFIFRMISKDKRKFMQAKPHPSPDSWIGSHTSPSDMHRANFLSSSGEGLAARHLQIFDYQSLQPLPLPYMKNLIKTQAMGRVSTDLRIGWRVRYGKQSFIFMDIKNPRIKYGDFKGYYEQRRKWEVPPILRSWEKSICRGNRCLFWYIDNRNKK